MEVKQVEITADDKGWKGTWYRKGQRHFVTDEPNYPAYATCRWRSTDICGGIQGAHAVELVGFRVWVRCRVKQLQLWLRRF